MMTSFLNAPNARIMLSNMERCYPMQEMCYTAQQTWYRKTWAEKNYHVRYAARRTGCTPINNRLYHVCHWACSCTLSGVQLAFLQTPPFSAAWHWSVSLSLFSSIIWYFINMLPFQWVWSYKILSEGILGEEWGKAFAMVSSAFYQFY